MNITKHFQIEAANCKDGTPLPVHLYDNAKKVAENVEVLRFAIGGIPIHVNSWYRTPEHNFKENGKFNSQHLLAKAMDIWVTGIDSFTLYVIVEALIRLGKMEEGGLGLYDGFIHYDNRGYLSRWDKRGRK